MARIFRSQGSSVARALLLALLFVVFANPAVLAQLYEQPVLVIDPGMHTAPIRNSAWTRRGGSLSLVLMTRRCGCGR